MNGTFAPAAIAAILARFRGKDDLMNPQIKRIVRVAFYGAVAAFGANWFFMTSGETLSVRLCFGFLVAGAGAVTGALLCANFTADEDEPLEGHSSGHEHRPT